MSSDFCIVCSDVCCCIVLHVLPAAVRRGCRRRWLGFCCLLHKFSFRPGHESFSHNFARRRPVHGKVAALTKVPLKLNVRLTPHTIYSLFLILTLYFEHCAPVRSCAAVSYLHLIDRVVSCARFLRDCEAARNLGHRHYISSISILYKIHADQFHPLNAITPYAFVPAIDTQLASNSQLCCLQQIRCHTNQFQRSFDPNAVKL